MTDVKVGILGGGQLGKMILMETAKWHLPISILDKDAELPARPFTPYYFTGSFNDYDDVLAFGQNLDVITVEIEHVNTDALRTLREQGKKIFPDPDTLDLIKDKGLQKEFYLKHKLPTPSAIFYSDKQSILRDINQQNIKFPFVQKSRSFGYDGKGVAIIKDEADLHKIMDLPSIIEPLIDLKHELAVITARDERGDCVHYEPVEMVFNNEANLLDVLVCPARVSLETRQACINLALDITRKYEIVGLLAIEFFIDHNDSIYINEVAPRPHNSGHHTIENTNCSQYEQHIRAILGLGLIQPTMSSPAVMFNLLGEADHNGASQLYGLSAALAAPNLYLHWYGKAQTKPYRKMGHVTILDDDIEKALTEVKLCKERLKCSVKT